MSILKGHPKGIYLVFVTSTSERFSYYGMRAIFVLFLTQALLLDRETAFSIYGSYTGMVYLAPLIGGYVADRYWGIRRSVFWGALIMGIGQLCMFFSASMLHSPSLAKGLMYSALVLLILGNGFFKPTITTLVGQLYDPGDKRIDTAYTIFYMGVNVGAFMAPLVCGYFGETGDPADYKWGFLVAALVIALTLIIFQTQKNKYLVTSRGEQIGIVPDAKRSAKAEEANPVPRNVERSRILVIFIIAVFVIFFWAAFEQAGMSLTLFAKEQTNRTLFGWEMPASWFQSFNPMFVVLLAFIMPLLWGFLHKYKMEPSSPTKQAIGLLLLSLGYLFICMGVKDLEPGTKISMLWLIGLYFIHTIGEMAVSPIGLSMVNRLSPVRFASLMMGIWYLSMAGANKFGAVLSSFYPGEEGAKSIFGIQIQSMYDFFMIFVVMAGIASLILFLLSKKLQKMMHGVE